MSQSQLSPGNKKIWILTAVIALAIIGLAWHAWQKEDEARAACVEVIDYLGGNSFYLLRGGKFESAPHFKTYDEAMAYCLQELKR